MHLRNPLPRGAGSDDKVREGWMSVTIEGLAKTFGHGSVLNGIDLAVNEGEFMALLGPSGSGKTSLLRIIAGLEMASAGRLMIGERDALNLPPRAAEPRGDRGARRRAARPRPALRPRAALPGAALRRAAPARRSRPRPRRRAQAAAPRRAVRRARCRRARRLARMAARPP